MIVKWSEELELGVQNIDDEHKTIVEEFEKLYALMRGGSGHDFYNLVIEFLEEYIETHLVHEEAYQAEIEYDKIEEHKKLHEAFRERVIQLREDHKMKKITDGDLLELNMVMQKWFVQHIKVEDRKIADFVKNKE